MRICGVAIGLTLLCPWLSLERELSIPFVPVRRKDADFAFVTDDLLDDRDAINRVWVGLQCCGM